MGPNRLSRVTGPHRSITSLLRLFGATANVTRKWFLISSERNCFREKSPVFPADTKEKGFHWTQKATQQQWHPVLRKHEVTLYIKMWAGKRVKVA